MSKRDLDRALEYIEHSGRGDFCGPQPEAVVIRAEQALHITFPPTYRMFLSRLGCGGVGVSEFFGTNQYQVDAACIPNAVWVTLRRRAASDLPLSHIIVGDTGDGGDYVIDTSQADSSGECPVLEWWSSAPDGHRVIAEDFGEFLWANINPPKHE